MSHKMFVFKNLFLKRIGFTIIIFLGTTVVAQINAYQVGDIVNNITATDTNGNTFDIYTQCESGKYVYIKFFTTTCSYCQSITPIFNEFYQKYGCNTSEIACVSVNGFTDNIGITAFEEQYGGSFTKAPAISTEGGSINYINRFLPGSYPTVCIISPDKTLIAKQIFPITSIVDLELSFPQNFNPEPTPCLLSSENDFINPIQILPNPAFDFIQVKSESQEIMQLTIYNNLSEKIKECSIDPNNELKLNLKTGLYILQIIQNDKIFYKKLIIEE